MRYILLILSVLTFTQGCKTGNPKIEVITPKGNIMVELYLDKAPVTAGNFINLVKNKKLEGAKFYRVVRDDNQPVNPVKIEVIQGGLFDDSKVDKIPAITHESTNETGILHRDGVISMARMEPGTASSEFFICIGAQPELDFGGRRNPDGEGFAAFGKVIKGMDVVRTIQQLPDTSQYLVEPVSITDIRIIL